MKAHASSPFKTYASSGYHDRGGADLEDPKFQICNYESQQFPLQHSNLSASRRYHRSHQAMRVRGHTSSAMDLVGPSVAY